MARERLQADDEAETSLLDRRSYLKLAGSAAAAVAAGSGGASAAEPVGFGEGGYGQMSFGGGAAASAPTVDRFDVSKSEQLGDDRMFSVRWAVADSDGDLDVVEVVVHEGAADVNFSVTDVSGQRGSGWDLFQFPVGSTLDVTLRAKDEGDRVVKESQSITL
ncbi:hypothetical protein [Halorussus pelagicus]|uniref:hypothetical protein n=1 Tax=Halorussus pelagicus TaxID=2505977 RepID=UPI000FFBB97D|nr:hypothetical protein [Halorussus pelagicus]